jgi:hypothetical protein
MTNGAFSYRSFGPENPDGECTIGRAPTAANEGSPSFLRGIPNWTPAIGGNVYCETRGVAAVHTVTGPRPTLTSLTT